MHPATLAPAPIFLRSPSYIIAAKAECGGRAVAFIIRPQLNPGGDLPHFASYSRFLAMNGTPMGVIAAQLGHADTRMTEKHYAHLAPGYVAQTVRENFPTLGIYGGGEIVPIWKLRA